MKCAGILMLFSIFGSRLVSLHLSDVLVCSLLLVHGFIRHMMEAMHNMDHNRSIPGTAQSIISSRTMAFSLLVPTRNRLFQF